jgi:hypothetical protein
MSHSVAQGQYAGPERGSSGDPQSAGPSARTFVLVFRGMLLCVAGFWLLGAVIFLRADGSVDYTLPRREAPPRAEHNFASYRYGPRIRASSYFRDAIAHHHPMFVVDERRSPSLMEKWASAEPDRRPWLSITWREPHDLARVRIQHAGMREQAELSARKYRLRCLTRDGVKGELMVEGNRAAVAEHPLICKGVLGLRIDFLRGRREEITRVFEVEAWGR